MTKNKKYLTPHGYSCGNMLIILAFIFGIWCTFIIASSVISGADIAEIAPFAVVAVIFVVGLVLSHIMSKHEAKVKNEYRNNMLNCERVQGEIVKFEQRPFLMSRELAPEKLKISEDGNIYNYKAKDRAYRVYVKYTDPFDNLEKEVVSELYTWFQMNEFDKEAFKSKKNDWNRLVVRDDVADVFIKSDGKAWTELILKK